MFEVVQDQGDLGACIKIVGVGSGGVNAVNTMIKSKVTGVEYIAMNTDVQSLRQSLAEVCLELAGPTRGRGAGGDPAKGREAAIQERPRIEEFLKGADMVVLATGLGGGTGTGATPVVAEIARGMGVLTIAVVTLPFSWEGKVKARRALEGLEVLKKVVDAYVIIPNDKLKKVASKGLPSLQAFAMVDQVLCDSMTGVVDLITRPGYVNRDFMDVEAVLKTCGLCVMGTGTGEGPDRAIDAVNRALYNPLLEDTPVEGARHVLVNVVMGPDGTMDENELIVSKINECMDPDGDISFGLAVDANLGDKIRVTIIASGLGDIETIEPRLMVEVAAPAKALPMDTRGLPVPTEQLPLPGMIGRPGFSDQPGLDRLRQFRNTPPYAINAAQHLAGYGEGESELDPTPAFMRIGGDTLRSTPSAAATVTFPGLPGNETRKV